MATEKPVIKEAIVVEGKDDVSAVLRAVEAAVIPTHGYGITEETLSLIAAAHERQGIIVFTDPDHAGEQIRRKITALHPDALQAYLTRGEAEKDGDIGIENASPEAIRAALRAAKAASAAQSDMSYLTPGLISGLGLTGRRDSAARRAALGKLLGIGQCNASAFLKRLRRFNISEEQLAQAVRQLEKEYPHE